MLQDGRPILIVSDSDIVWVLRHNSIMSGDVEEWLNTLDQSDLQFCRLVAYQNARR